MSLTPSKKHSVGISMPFCRASSNMVTPSAASQRLPLMVQNPISPSLSGVTVIRMPEGTAPEHKHFVGFYDGEGQLTAILDLITGYPEQDDAFLGWFMVDAKQQGAGIGSQIFADLRAALRAQGYDRLSVAVPPENSEAVAFWEKQGFTDSGQEMVWNERKTSIMERNV